jgi:hypothetical protein
MYKHILFSYKNINSRVQRSKKTCVATYCNYSVSVNNRWMQKCHYILAHDGVMAWNSEKSETSKLLQVSLQTEVRG